MFQFIWFGSHRTKCFDKTNYLVSAAGVAAASTAGVASGATSVAGWPSAGAASVAAGVASVSGAFLEQVKPVVKESASNATITIAFMCCIPFIVLISTAFSSLLKMTQEVRNFVFKLDVGPKVHKA